MTAETQALAIRLAAGRCTPLELVEAATLLITLADRLAEADRKLAVLQSPTPEMVEAAAHILALNTLKATGRATDFHRLQDVGEILVAHHRHSAVQLITEIRTLLEKSK